jgi:adenylate cyclase
VNPKTFLVELKRRNVYRAAVLYGMAAWLIVQIATQVSPFFDVPNWAVRFVIVAVVIGFPIAMLLAWIFEAHTGRYCANGRGRSSGSDR